MDINFERDATIDPDALDIEWLEQPRMMIRYGKVLAEAKKAYEETKQRLDVVKAEVDKDVRANPSDYGLEKTTESAIAGAVSTAKKVQESQKEMHEASYEVNLAQAAVYAINARKDALENLVRLHGQQYFAGPKIPRDLSKEWEAKAKQTDANVTVGRIRRRRTE